MDNASKCTKCSKNIGPKAEAITCDVCQRKVHAKCIGLSSKSFLASRTIKNKHFKTLCTKCEPQFAQEFAPTDPVMDCDLDPDETCIPAATSTSTPCPPVKFSYADAVISDSKWKNEIKDVKQNHLNKGERGDQPSQNDDLKPIWERFKKLEELIAKLRIDETQQKTSLETKPQPARKETPKRTDVWNRQQSVIMFNIPESDKANSQERLDHDLSEIRKCFELVLSDCDIKDREALCVRSAFRLGQRKQEAETRPRPLKVVFGSSDQARLILQNSFHLKGMDVRIKQDLAPENRMQLREAIGQLKEKINNGDDGWTIQNFRLVKKRPRILWKPIVLTQRTIELIPTTLSLVDPPDQPTTH